MQPPIPTQYLPLHKGRSFICYRDVNRAIEKHREVHGLRLVLKRAVKLENYCLSVDQMRDLNFRLKYGELDYQCAIDNGRPGRPQNDERCPQLVRLRLSPDARSLVVFDTHIHDTSPEFTKGNTPPCPDNTVPVISLGKSGLSQSSMASGSTMKPPSRPVTPQRPTTPSKQDLLDSSDHKLTMKIKKSQFSPHEMVVVGSPRDAEEQRELRTTPEKNENVFIKSLDLENSGSRKQISINTNPKVVLDRSIVKQYQLPFEQATGSQVQEKRGAGRPPGSLNRIPERIMPSRTSVSSTTNGVKGAKYGMNLKPIHKKKKTRYEEEVVDMSTLPPMDTELAFSSKQQVAHGILLGLLRVTSQLPMVEFSHALETFEMLTDALKLGQRVHLSIRNDEEDEDENVSYDYGEYDDDDDDEEMATGMEAATMEMENEITSTTDLHEQQLVESQIDTQDESPDQTDEGSASGQGAINREIQYLHRANVAEKRPSSMQDEESNVYMLSNVAEKRPTMHYEEDYYEDDTQGRDIDVKG